MLRLVKCLVAKRRNNGLILAFMVLMLITVLGCGVGKSGPTKDLKVKINNALSQADKLLVRKIYYNDQGKYEVLKNRYQKGSKGFLQVRNALGHAGPKGTVVQSSSDRTIVIIKSDRILLKLAYCSKDGRLQVFDSGGAKLFVPSNLRYVIK